MFHRLEADATRNGADVSNLGAWNLGFVWDLVLGI
jgi:hypothetical protein